MEVGTNERPVKILTQLDQTAAIKALNQSVFSATPFAYWYCGILLQYIQDGPRAGVIPMTVQNQMGNAALMCAMTCRAEHTVNQSETGVGPAASTMLADYVTEFAVHHARKNREDIRRQKAGAMEDFRSRTTAAADKIGFVAFSCEVMALDPEGHPRHNVIYFGESALLRLCVQSAQLYTAQSISAGRNADRAALATETSETITAAVEQLVLSRQDVQAQIARLSAISN